MVSIETNMVYVFVLQTPCMIAAGTLHTQYAPPFNTTVAAHNQ